jgi:hypothetical protein
VVRTQIQLTEEQVKAIKKMAASRRVSGAALIRHAVDAMIKSGVAADIEERRKRAIDIVGKFRSGKRDVSKRHDEYLAGTFLP